MQSALYNAVEGDTNMVHRPILACLALLGAVGLCACNHRDSKQTGDPDMTVQTKTNIITLRSDAFGAGGKIPKKYGGEGQNISPPLRWSGVPAGVKELVLIVDDPDAPGKDPYVHWILYNISATDNSLGEGVAKTPQPSSPAGARQGQNSQGTVGYTGPMPPPGHGVHHYHFHLIAVDKNLNLNPELQNEHVLGAIHSADVHILAEGELIGTYERR
jgi:Raf kinase inhibitor-like YbhB/YbcL family protein